MSGEFVYRHREDPRLKFYDRNTPDPFEIRRREETNSDEYKQCL